MCICAAPRTPVEGVIVYGRQLADDYQAVCRFFRDRGVQFEPAEVEDDPANLQVMTALSGQQEATVIKIGKKILVGFDQVELDRVLP